MKKICSTLILLWVFGGCYLAAQNDSIERIVTVEREFQPIIQPAGKISAEPLMYTPVLKPAEVVYSSYSQPMGMEYNLGNLGYSSLNFIHPKPLNGFLRGGVGHNNTVFDFSYRVSDKKGTNWDIYANHLGKWGRKTLSSTQAGMNFSKLFSAADLFFDVNGKNTFFTRYGKYFTYSDPAKGKGDLSISHYRDLSPSDKTSLWEIDTRIGVRSLPKQEIQYLVQTGYEAFVMGKTATEHQIHSEAMLDWHRNEHHAGGNVVVLNRLYSAGEIDWNIPRSYGNDTILQNHHVVKVEPYYAYAGNRFNIHAGVNFDLVFGKGKVFLPSPNVTLEAQLAKKWLALYGGAVGDYMVTSVRDNFRYNHFLHPELEITDTHNRTYMPVDAFLGFKIRPHADLLLNLYTHYILTKYDVFYQSDKDGYFTLVSSDHQRWKIGGKFDCHYQDIVNIHLDGHYTVWKMKSIDYAYYRPSWEINFRVDAKINSKISLYSDNYFAGGRYALYGSESILLKPTIDLNLGAQYNIDKWLSCYLQLNNYLNRKHDFLYTYQTDGINFVAGVTWSF